MSKLVKSGIFVVGLVKTLTSAFPHVHIFKGNKNLLTVRHAGISSTL